MIAGIVIGVLLLAAGVMLLYRPGLEEEWDEQEGDGDHGW